jgi:hypothetical protein
VDELRKMAPSEKKYKDMQNKKSTAKLRMAKPTREQQQLIKTIK